MNPHKTRPNTLKRPKRERIRIENTIFKKIWFEKPNLEKQKLIKQEPPLIAIAIKIVTQKYQKELTVAAAFLFRLFLYFINRFLRFDEAFIGKRPNESERDEETKQSEKAGESQNQKGGTLQKRQVKHRTK